MTKRRLSLVYHQFELFDPSISSGLNKLTQIIVLKNAKLIDFTIFPEINRSHFFYELTGNIPRKSMIMPNTNNLVNQMIGNEDQIAGIPEKNTVVAHIGNLGSAHYTLKYFEFIQQNTNPDLTFLFIGKVDSKLLPVLNSMAEKDNRVLIIKEVLHRDLIKYYNKIDIGIILYKAVDKNNEYCAPNKLYEYWAHGIPVIAHQLKSLEDIWRYDFQGSLIDFEKMSQMEASIHELIENKSTYPVALREWFRKEASIDTYLPVLLDKIENL